MHEGSAALTSPPVGVEEVPGGKCKRENSKPVCEQCIAASVDLPASPEGNGGCDDHQDAAKRVHEEI